MRPYLTLVPSAEQPEAETIVRMLLEAAAHSSWRNFGRAALSFSRLPYDLTHFLFSRADTAGCRTAMRRVGRLHATAQGEGMFFKEICLLNAASYSCLVLQTAHHSPTRPLAFSARPLRIQVCSDLHVVWSYDAHWSTLFYDAMSMDRSRNSYLIGRSRSQIWFGRVLPTS
jgi:hypothetical protein